MWCSIVKQNYGKFEVEIRRCFETLKEAFELQQFLIEQLEPAANPKLGGARPGALRQAA